MNEITIRELQRIQGDFENMFFVRSKRLRRRARSIEERQRKAEREALKRDRQARRLATNEAKRYGAPVYRSELPGESGSAERIEALRNFYGADGAFAIDSEGASPFILKNEIF